MADSKSLITTSEKIKKSNWKRGAVMELLGLYKNKFATKMKYNDWEPAEIKKLKDNKVID